MADHEEKDVVALTQNVGEVTIEDRASDKPAEEEDKTKEGGVMSFIDGSDHR